MVLNGMNPFIEEDKTSKLMRIVRVSVSIETY